MQVNLSSHRLVSGLVSRQADQIRDDSVCYCRWARRTSIGAIVEAKKRSNAATNKHFRLCHGKEKSEAVNKTKKGTEITLSQRIPHVNVRNQPNTSPTTIIIVSILCVIRVQPELRSLVLSLLFPLIYPWNWRGPQFCKGLYPKYPFLPVFIGKYLMLRRRRPYDDEDEAYDTHAEDQHVR